MMHLIWLLIGYCVVQALLNFWLLKTTRRLLEINKDLIAALHGTTRGMAHVQSLARRTMRFAHRMQNERNQALSYANDLARHANAWYAAYYEQLMVRVRGH